LKIIISVSVHFSINPTFFTIRQKFRVTKYIFILLLYKNLDSTLKMSKITGEIQQSFKKGSLLTKLIYINVGLFVPFWFIDLFSESFIGNWIAVQANFHDLLFRPWTPITYMFTHTTFLHLLFNMLTLFWFGKIFLQFLHQKQLFAVYVLGGIFGGLLHVVANEFLPYPAPAIGASAAVMAVVLATAAYRPEHPIHLIFIGAVKLKYVALVMIVLDLMGLASNMSIAKMDGVAHMAHLGGALYGLWFGYKIGKGKDITASFNRLMDKYVVMFTSSKTERNRSSMKAQKSQPSRKPPGRDPGNPDWEYRDRQRSDEAELNRILDKISEKGYTNLTDAEKEFLFKQKKD